MYVEPSMADLGRAQRLFRALRADLKELSPEGRSSVLDVLERQASPGVAMVFRHLLDDDGLKVA